MKADFAAVLGCKEKAIQARLIALGHATTCGRCGGGGQYSFCQMYGTTCFGCAGSGKVATKLTAALLETVRVQVAAGELQPYLDRLARVAKCKTFTKRLYDAWGALPSVAAENGKHFTECSERHHAVNRICAPLVNEARAVSFEVTEQKRYDKPARKWVPLTDAELDARLARLDAILLEVQNAESKV